MPALLIRLPNHLGDTLMTLPALERLAAGGHAPVLIGKPWAAPLLAAYGWPVYALAPTLAGAVAQWRGLMRSTGSRRVLLFTNSFGSALAARLAGARATGFAIDGRGWLLSQPVNVPARWHGDMHTVEYYDALAAALLGAPVRAVPPIELRLVPAAHQAARALLAQAGLRAPFVMLCPGAAGRHRGRDKTWPHFTDLARWLIARGEQVAALPGPGERERFAALLPGATILPATDVATFGAVLAASRLVIANDSGPGHLAAAVGARLVSLFGVTEIEKTRPWGRHVTLLGSAAGWPTFDAVSARVADELARADARDGQR